MCALSNFSITTRHSNTQVGTRLVYDKSGLILSKDKTARSIGTTVTLEKIFHTLAVRHKEFLKNLKKEYNKLIHVIQCYCLISEGIKVSCFHVMSDKTTKLMCTQSKNSLKDNIIEIFGLASFKNMVSFEQVEPSDDILIEYKIKKPSDSIAKEKSTLSLTTSSINTDENKENSIQGDTTQKVDTFANQFKIEGFVSNASHGQGRSAPGNVF